MGRMTCVAPRTPHRLLAWSISSTSKLPSLVLFLRRTMRLDLRNGTSPHGNSSHSTLSGYINQPKNGAPDSLGHQVPPSPSSPHSNHHAFYSLLHNPLSLSHSNCTWGLPHSSEQMSLLPLLVPAILLRYHQAECQRRCRCYGQHGHLKQLGRRYQRRHWVQQRRKHMSYRRSYLEWRYPFLEGRVQLCE